ncbi:unnamed protein product [Linum trigynum]|uniref:KIB1-4 beta-propeller domain-containing protein n=1 Tax=Linum trigynum TaxID=586398 RepID=A0AAV2F0X7_9ROSI
MGGYVSRNPPFHLRQAASFPPPRHPLRLRLQELAPTPLSDVQIHVAGIDARNYQRQHGRPITWEEFRSRIVAKAGAWLLLRESGLIYACFNPLLRYPASLINLPPLSMHYCTYPNPRPIKGVFSALPTARDWMILVVYGTRYFSTLRRGNWFWRTYDFSLNGERAQICLGVAYRDKKFFCLFEKGDMLIYNVDRNLHKNERRRMLTTTKPLLSEQLDHLDSLYVVVAPMTTTTKSARDCQCEEVGGDQVEVMVVSWNEIFGQVERTTSGY